MIIDAGNTQIKWAIYNGKSQLLKKAASDWDDFRRDLPDAAFPELLSAVISSVRKVPVEVVSELHNRFPFVCELAYDIPLPVKISYKTPETLGKDRIAAAVGGAALFPGKTVLIIDLGTAITYDLITAEPAFAGGNISPGMFMRFKALGHFTDDLPTVSPSDKVALIGQSTVEALQSGVQQGITYEIDACINALINKYDGLRVILTGGDAPFFVKNLKNTIFVVPDLVLDGLNLILDHQKENFKG